MLNSHGSCSPRSLAGQAIAVKVAHICPVGYTDGLTYQENMLTRQHRADGHDVLIIASTERLDSQSRWVPCPPGRSLTADGIPLIRLPHPPLLPVRIARKVRWMTGLREALEAFKPDAALFHGLQSASLITYRNFQRSHPEVHCHVDCHTDPYTSGTSWISRTVLHRLMYRPLVRRGMRGLGPLLCISRDVQRFVTTLYGFKVKDLSFYPLGGVVHDDVEYARLRSLGRAKVGARPDQLVLLQTGKMDSRKRLPETLRAFQAASIPNAILVVAGSLAEDNRAEAERLMASNPSVKYLGWVNAELLAELLCACDLYVQPGAQSATMQMAICSRCPVVLRDFPSHAPFVSENGWLVNDEADVLRAFEQVRENGGVLKRMAEQSHRIASTLLDYRALADRVLHARKPS